jgi:hypothetical protein
MVDAPPHSHHFPLLMLPGDLPMVMQSEDFTQLLELGNLTTLEQTHGKYGKNVVSKADFLPLSPKQLRLQEGASSPWLKFQFNCAFPVFHFVFNIRISIFFTYFYFLCSFTLQCIFEVYVNSVCFFCMCVSVCVLLWV